MLSEPYPGIWPHIAYFFYMLAAGQQLQGFCTVSLLLECSAVTQCVPVLRLRAQLCLSAVRLNGKTSQDGVLLTPRGTEHPPWYKHRFCEVRSNLLHHWIESQVVHKM